MIIKLNTIVVLLKDRGASMGDAKRRCIGCMREFDADIHVCPYCGFDDETPIAKDYLKPRTFLHDRYLVGKPLRYNGEGISYIGYDYSVDSVVEIREYFPDQLCFRAEDGSQNLVIQPGCETKFKTFLIDFMELNENLMKMRTLTSFEQTYQVFEENNTAYAVREHVEGITFAQYLQENAGELDWPEVYELFKPLLENITVMHGYQILHRGISPDTIRVTKSGALKLCDFCISAARNIKTGITSQIYVGYAAPEQFSASIYQGTWTDVYAICAVIYRALTGSRPPEFNNRGYKENIIPPGILNSSVPQDASDAIMQGLSQLTDNRTKTAGILLSQLRNIEKNEPDIQIDLEEDEEIEPPEKPKRYGLMALLITGGILIVVGIFLIIFVLWGGNSGDSSSSSSSSSESSSSSSESSSMSSSWSSSSSSSSMSSSDNQSSVDQNQNTFSMISLKGELYQWAKDDTTLQALFNLQAEYEYSDEVEEGYIIEQDIKEGEIIPVGSTVKVTVSKGTRYPTIPSFTSTTTKDQYTAWLDELNIPFTISVVTTGKAQSGVVVDTNPKAGSSIDLESGVKVVVSVES